MKPSLVPHGHPELKSRPNRAHPLFRGLIQADDLTQYTLAIDRQNAKLDRFYDSHHPAVLKMIQMVIDSAHEEGIWAGICGELGADLTLTETFVKMGIDELSVSPAMVLPVRNKIINA